MILRPGTTDHLFNWIQADAVAFGRLFIANPDLPARLASDALLNVPDGSTFLAPGPNGYTEYPALNV
jgi:2,4-dienoyl-CoA reductase-like NADH-dependent reductase (Old Yellow Enzyme family)